MSLSAYLGPHCVKVTQTNHLYPLAEGGEFLLGMFSSFYLYPIGNSFSWVVWAIMKASPYSKLKIKTIISEREG